MSKAPRVQIKVRTEEAVEAMTGFLMDQGFEYDGDFTTLYGAEWKITGLLITGRHADVFSALEGAGYLKGDA